MDDKEDCTGQKHRQEPPPAVKRTEYRAEEQSNGGISCYYVYGPVGLRFFPPVRDTRPNRVVRKLKRRFHRAAVDLQFDMIFQETDAPVLEHVLLPKAGFLRSAHRCLASSLVSPDALERPGWSKAA